MKKISKYIAGFFAFLVFLTFITSVAFAQIGGGGGIQSGGFWKLVGTRLSPVKTTYTVGNSSNRVAGVYGDVGDFTSLAIGGTVTGDLDMNGASIVNVDEISGDTAPVTIGTGGTPTVTTANDLFVVGDVEVGGYDLSIGQGKVKWDTADANANALKIGLPNGDATNVPYLHIGRASDINGVDLGIGAGGLRPRLVFWDNSLSKRIEMGWGTTYFEIAGGTSAHQLQIQTTVNTAQVIVGNDSPIVFGTTAQGSIRRNVTFGDDDVRFSLGTEPLIFATVGNVGTGYGKGTVPRPTIYLTSETPWGTSTAQWVRLQHDTTAFLVETGAGNIKLAPATGSYVVLNSSKSDTGDPTGEEGMIYINTFDNAAKIYADGAWRTITTW